MEVEFRIGLNLGAGPYTLTVALCSDATHLVDSYDWWDKVIAFQVVPGPTPFFIGTASLPVQLRVQRQERVVAAPRDDREAKERA